MLVVAVKKKKSAKRIVAQLKEKQRDLHKQRLKGMYVLCTHKYTQAVYENIINHSLSEESIKESKKCPVLHHKTKSLVVVVLLVLVLVVSFATRLVLWCNWIRVKEEEEKKSTTEAKGSLKGKGMNIPEA